MNCDPASHRIVNRAVLHEGDRGDRGRCWLRRPARQMEMHRVVHDAAALPELFKFDALYLITSKALANDSVATKIITGRFADFFRDWGVALRDNPNAARQ